LHNHQLVCVLLHCNLSWTKLQICSSLARDLGVPKSHGTQMHNIALESGIIMIGVLLNHKTRIHNIALESIIIVIGVFLSHETRIHNITLECKYYDWHVVRRE